MKLKWKQIEIVNEDRINSKGEKVDWEVYSPDYSGEDTTGERGSCQSGERAAFEEVLEDWIEEKSAPLTITPDTLVFGDPEKHFQPFAYDYIPEMEGDY